MIFQSTLPLRGATWIKPTPTVSIKISIHAPLAGSDSWSWTTRRTAADFNPRSPCGERPGGDIQTASTALIFQSTLPLRGATDLRGSAIKRSSISIHAPLAGSDLWPFICCWLTEFQSTLPLRGATRRKHFRRWYHHRISIHAPLAGSDQSAGNHEIRETISIHAPLAGSDKRINEKDESLPHFNPRSPCGERLLKQVSNSLTESEFQSTLPLRGATRRKSLPPREHRYFNPRSPCGERRAATISSTSDLYFNPRSPCGERRASSRAFVCSMVFQSTLPLRGATIASIISRQLGGISIHAPLAGSDALEVQDGSGRRISIHAPLAGSDCLTRTRNVSTT